MATAEAPTSTTGHMPGFVGVMNYVCSNTSYLVGSITNDRCPRGVWLRGGTLMAFALSSVWRTIIVS